MYSIQEYRIAESLEEAYALLNASPKNTILAGGLWLRMTRRSIRTAIDLSRLGLDQIEAGEREIAIGAMATLRDLETADCLKSAFGGVLPEAVKHIVGVQFRNMATVGASVYSRYGFSDVITALLALDTDVELYHAGRMTLESFLQSQVKRDILTHIYIKKECDSAVYQTLRRTQTDFGVLDMCLAKTGKTYRLSVGARPMRAIRCREAEAQLAEGDIVAAEKTVAALSYGANMRGSAEYRSAMASVLLRRAYEALKEGEA